MYVQELQVLKKILEQALIVNINNTHKEFINKIILQLICIQVKKFIKEIIHQVNYTNNFNKKNLFFKLQ